MHHLEVSEPLTRDRVAEYFTAMFRRKAFLHWYTGEGAAVNFSRSCCVSQ